MYVQISRVKIQEGLMEDALKLVRESVLPVVFQQKGFVRFYLLADRVNCEIVIENFWETFDDVDALQTNGFYQDQVRKFEGIFASAPQRSVYELAIEHGS